MKHILRFVSLTFCAFLLSLHASAQTYRPGFVMQANGDTLTGLIKYSEGDRTYSRCVFKTDADAEEKEYFPGDIMGYGITGDAPLRSKDIVDDKGIALKAFVEAVESGKLSLYQYKRLLFLEKEASGLKLLQLETDNTSALNRAGEAHTVTTSTKHLILINSFTFDCPVPEALMLKVQKRLNVPDVVAVVKAYNNCVEPNSSTSYKKDKSWLAVEKGLFIGGSTGSINFGHTPTLRDTEFSTSQNVVFGVLLNFTSPKKSEKISVQAEPLFSKEKYQGSYTYTSESYIRQSAYTVSSSRFSLVTMLRYTLTTDGSLKPYLALGLSSNRILSSSITGRHETRYTNGFERTETSRTEIGSNIYFSPTAAIGTRYQISKKHEVLLQCRYEHGRYLAIGPNTKADLLAYLSDQNKTLYLTAAYVLK